MTTGTKIAFGVCAVLVLGFLVVTVVYLVRRRWALAFWAFVVALEAFTLPPAMDVGNTDRAVFNSFGLSFALVVFFALSADREATP